MGYNKTNHKNKKTHFSGKPPTIKDKTTTKAKWNLFLVLAFGQAQKCHGVKPINWIITTLFVPTRHKFYI